MKSIVASKQKELSPEDKTCQCGNIIHSLRCKAENDHAHVCTRKLGHEGMHHSHTQTNLVFSEWEHQN